MVPWVGLQCVIVVFPDHTHLLFNTNSSAVNAVLIMSETQSEDKDLCETLRLVTLDACKTLNVVWHLGVKGSLCVCI